MNVKFPNPTDVKLRIIMLNGTPKLTYAEPTKMHNFVMKTLAGPISSTCNEVKKDVERKGFTVITYDVVVHLGKFWYKYWITVSPALVV